MRAGKKFREQIQTRETKFQIQTENKRRYIVFMLQVLI